MKLYTEEQVRNMLDTFLLFTGNEDANDCIEYMTPIELPSDEEIEEKAEFLFPTVNIMGGPTYIAHKSFIEGVKWMRNKITNTKEK